MSAESVSAAAAAGLADVPHEPGAPKPDPILVADDVVRRFGGLTASTWSTSRSSAGSSPP
jgi:hypothetical protein